MIFNFLDAVQDINSDAWKKLCDYIERLAEEGTDTFRPSKELSEEEYSQIFTLPPSISRLGNVTNFYIYGSSICYIPPEIGEMKSLKEFTPYTSYSLQWFPYEITECTKLKNSTISTRALYGNFKNRMEFPDLTKYRFLYREHNCKCSICHKEINCRQTDQYWTTQWVGTDDIPLLLNCCSNECLEQVPDSNKIFNQRPHKGGSTLIQPTKDYWDLQATKEEKVSLQKKSGIINKLKNRFSRQWRL